MRTTDPDPSFPVAMPLLCDDWDTDFRPILARLQASARKHARLIVYPECMFKEMPSPGQFLDRVARFAGAHGIPTLGSAYMLEDDERQLAAALVHPDPGPGDTSSYLYRKHTQSPRIAFDNPDWIERFEEVYLRPIPCAGRVLGITLCHDQTVSLLQRSLALRGADLLVNPSFGWIPNHDKWALWLRARAVETGVPVIATMFASAGEPRKHGYVYAFGPSGQYLPLEWIPNDPAQERLLYDGSYETEPDDEGFYLVQVPPALKHPDVPARAPGRRRRTLVLAGEVKRRLTARTEIFVGGDPSGSGSSPGSVATALGPRTIVVTSIDSSAMFEPEACARALLRAEREHRGVPRPLFVLVNTWSRLPAGTDGERLRVVAAARALEHACFAVLVETDSDRPVEAFSSTNYRMGRTLPCEGTTVPIVLDGKALVGGGPARFFSDRPENRFARHRPAYEALLRSCEVHAAEASR